MRRNCIVAIRLIKYGRNLDIRTIKTDAVIRELTDWVSEIHNPIKNYDVSTRSLALCYMKSLFTQARDGNIAADYTLV